MRNTCGKPAVGNLTSSFWMVQFAPRPIFWGNHDPGHRIPLYCLGHVLYAKWWLGTRRRLGDLFRFVSFNLHLDWNFVENLYLIRKIWNSHRSSWYGLINDCGWNEDQVTFSDLFHSTCIWTGILRRTYIWSGKFEILIVAPEMA